MYHLCFVKHLTLNPFASKMNGIFSGTTCQRDALQNWALDCHLSFKLIKNEIKRCKKSHLIVLLVLSKLAENEASPVNIKEHKVYTCTYLIGKYSHFKDSTLLQSTFV